MCFRAPLARNYETEKAKIAAKSAAAVVHPLLPNRPKEIVSQSPSPKSGATSSKVTSVKSPVAASAGGDPLSGFIDPLSAMTISAPIVDPLLNTVVAPIDDPLSNSSAAFKPKATETRSQNIEVARQTAKAIHESNLNTSWQNRKQQILKDYVYSGEWSYVNASIYLCHLNNAHFTPCQETLRSTAML
jgi:hypothetical protein